jgi:hypothetical protein
MRQNPKTAHQPVMAVCVKRSPGKSTGDDTPFIRRLMTECKGAVYCTCCVKQSLWFESLTFYCGLQPTVAGQANIYLLRDLSKNLEARTKTLSVFGLFCVRRAW